MALRNLFGVFALLSFSYLSAARADLSDTFNNVCGAVVSNLGCGDVAAEYSVLFGTATTAVELAHSQGLVSNNIDCRNKLSGGNPALQDILNIINQVSGSGVGHFIKCSCDVALSNTSCSDFLKGAASSIVKGISSFGKEAGKVLKQLGCDLGISSCGQMPPELKKAIYFSCRQLGYTEVQIEALSAFGFGDPSGLAYKNISAAAPCFFLKLAMSNDELNYYETYYHSVLACGPHKGVALADPGRPADFKKRVCLDGSMCQWLGGDSWQCQPGVVPSPRVVSEGNIHAAKARRAQSVAQKLGAICGIDSNDDLEVSCGTFEKAQACFRELGSCRASKGLFWDDACCTLKGGASAQSREIRRALEIAGQVGPSCGVSPQDPLEVDCATLGTYAICMNTVKACTSSDGWYWDRACCRLKGGASNPSFQARKAAHVLGLLKSSLCRIHQEDALQIECKHLPEYLSCQKQLPNACHAAPGSNHYSEACCTLGWKN